MKMYLIFSHSLTDAQREDAKENLKVSEFVKLPEELQKKWSNVPPEAEKLDDYLEPFREWVDKNGNGKHFFLIQGEAGAVYHLVDYIKSFNVGKAVHATTKRISVEEEQADGSVQKRSVFKHVRFRQY